VGLEIKTGYPIVQVSIYDSVDNSQTIVQLPAAWSWRRGRVFFFVRVAEPDPCRKASSLGGASAPPRDPNEDEDEVDQEDGGDEDEDREPAVIREPDEDQSRLSV
jgi:hypothetical protein